MRLDLTEARVQVSCTQRGKKGGRRAGGSGRERAGSMDVGEMEMPSIKGREAESPKQTQTLTHRRCLNTKTWEARGGRARFESPEKEFQDPNRVLEWRLHFRSPQSQGPYRKQSTSRLLLIEIMGWSMDLVVRQIRSAPGRYLAAIKSPIGLHKSPLSARTNRAI